MLESTIGDITQIRGVEYICNAANPQGIMGAGVAGAIARAAGERFLEEVRRVAQTYRVKAGGIYVTSAGNLPYRGIIHLASVPAPGRHSTYSIVESCLRNLVQFASSSQATAIALPLLGTGVGRLDPAQLKSLYQKYLQEHRTRFVVVEFSHAVYEAFVRG